MPQLSELLGESIPERDQLLVLVGYVRGLMAGKTKGLKERNRLLGELILEGVRFRKLQLVLDWSPAHLRRVLLQDCGLNWATIKQIERRYAERERARGRYGIPFAYRG